MNLQIMKKYPDCIYSESKKSDQYNHIVIEAMDVMKRQTK